MLLVWGATRLFGFYHKMSKISIHAPRVGSDSKDTQILLRIFGEEVEYLLLCGRDAGASMEGKR